LSIGTAKPTIQERKDVEHYMVDVVSAQHPLTAADYLRQAIPIIDELHRKGNIVILTGGSAFYLRALIKGMYQANTSLLDNQTPSISLGSLSDSELNKKLAQCDPVSAKKIHPNDRYRIQRAVEYFEQHAKPFSEAAKSVSDPYDFTTPQFPQWRHIHFYLSWPKEILWHRILERVELMFEQGIVEEHQNLLKMGFSGQERPLQSVGHFEVGQYINGSIKNLEECKERIAISTRQLAKSQRTFFNKINPKHNIDPRKSELLYELLKQFMNNKLE
jgi:tRNA dimethylallyltransferase